MKHLIAPSLVLIVLLLVSSITHACGWYIGYKDLTGKTYNYKAFDTAKECEADKANRIKTAQQEFANISQPDKSDISNAEKRVREKFRLIYGQPQPTTAKYPLPGLKPLNLQQKAEINLSTAVSSFCSFAK